jgi:regulator of RNase E activity RraA
MVINTDIIRPSRKVIKSYNALFSGIISDAMHKSGAMNSEIKSIMTNVKMVGPAITVRTHAGDILTLIKAIDIAKAGDVLVVDAQGFKDSALWGELTSRSALNKGIVGLVIDGAVRDVLQIRKIRFPVFCRGISPCNGTADFVGDINIQIQCGGVSVNPGDIIFGDDDGVVVIPLNDAEEILGTAQSIQESEEIILKKIGEGITIGELSSLDEVIEKKSKEPITSQLSIKEDK